MSDRPHGKHVVIDEQSPDALGICDKTGFVFRRKDMVKQMEWRGNALVWTGFIVGREYADTPNAQLRPPILPPDPVPVKWPRLQQPSSVVWNNQSIYWNLLPVYDWVSWAGLEDGIPASPESQRLSALQQGVQPSTSYGGAGYVAGALPLTQAQILAQLQSATWGPANT